MFFDGQFIPFLPSSIAMMSLFSAALIFVVGLILSRRFGERCFAITCFTCLAIMTIGGIYSVRPHGLKPVTPQQISVVATHLTEPEVTLLKREVSRNSSSAYNLLQLEHFLEEIEELRDNPPIVDANKKLILTLDGLGKQS